jgi:hypothetical protein
MTAGTAIRIVVSVFVILGAWGWGRWLALFELPVLLSLTVAGLLPWARYSSNGFFDFTPETFVFGVGPWMLLAAHAIGAEWRNGTGCGIRRAVLAGTLLGVGYMLKYSMLLPVVGVVLFLAWSAFSRRGRANRHVDRQHRRIAFEFACIVGVLGSAVAGLSVVNHRAGGAANLVMTAVAPAVDLRSIPEAIGAPAQIAASLDAVLRYLLLRPGHPVVPDERGLLLIGVPVVLGLVWAMWSRRPWNLPGQLTMAVLLSSVVCLIVVWNVSGVVDHSARHVAVAGLAGLPLGLQVASETYRGSGAKVRRGLWLTGAIYVGLPLLYGPVSVAAKIARTPRPYGLAVSGFYNPLLAYGDAETCANALASVFEPSQDVWYVIDPNSALDLPGRMIVVQADFIDRSAPARPLRIRALLPDKFEAEGKGAVIRASFMGAGAWERTSYPACQHRLWTTTLSPHSNVLR